VPQKSGLNFMKKYSLLVAMAVSMMACQNKTDATATTETTTQETKATTSATPVTASAKIKDPVCGMPMEGEHFTEFTTSGTDTTWFCSPHCKDQYMKNPEKYKQPAQAPKG
jgi:YHS domain-containing protein